MLTTSLKMNKVSESKIKSVDFENLSFGKEFTDHVYIADYKDGQWHDMRIEPFGNFSIHPANIAWQLWTGYI